MKKILIALAFIPGFLWAQMNPIVFEEYDLDNGLHVILHEDHTVFSLRSSISRLLFVAQPMERQQEDRSKMNVTFTLTDA